jgi:hypothetical protein
VNACAQVHLNTSHSPLQQPSCCSHLTYRSGTTYRTTLIIAPANISLLNDVFAWLIVPLIAVGHFQFIISMYWTLQNLKDSETSSKHCTMVSLRYLATIAVSCLVDSACLRFGFDSWVISSWLSLVIGYPWSYLLGLHAVVFSLLGRVELWHVSSPLPNVKYVHCTSFVQLWTTSVVPAQPKQCCTISSAPTKCSMC